MARLIGWDYVKGDIVTVATQEAVDHLGNEPRTALLVGTVLRVTSDGIDSDGEVYVMNDATGVGHYVHFLLIEPIGHVNDKFQTPEQVEEFLQKEDPWR